MNRQNIMLLLEKKAVRVSEFHEIIRNFFSDIPCHHATSE